MNTKFYTSTNWLPWMIIGVILSSIFLGFISDIWLQVLLVVLSFFPMIVVRLTLQGYFIVDNFELRYCYDRKKGRQTSFSLPISDISDVKRVGKSVVIHYDKGEVYSSRVHESEAFVHELTKYNPKIEIITD